jgi:RNA polymerase sigma-70 factor (ECF subfamily)
VRVWQKLKTLKGQSAFSSWLHRLTIHLVIDRMRWERRRSKWETISDDLESSPMPRRNSTPETRLALEAAVAALPPGARIAFVLHDVEGYRHDEIAKIVGVASGTSKAQLHRARRLLRKMLR